MSEANNTPDMNPEHDGESLWAEAMEQQKKAETGSS